MMKTLYISDLDGTLLDTNAELSEYTVDTINRLIHNGLCFSVATARTAATCDRLLERLNINVPIILMNGVLIYSLSDRQYIKKEILSKDKTLRIISAMRKTGQMGFMYGLIEDRLVTYYEKLENPSMKEFVEERVSKYNKKFTRVDDFSDTDTEIIYFCFIDSGARIQMLYDEIIQIQGLRIEKYQDIYSNGDIWYAEVFCDTASKYNAVLFLRERYGFDHVVSFGDNLNDIPMFEASDVCHAVVNAKDEVKTRADDIIDSNSENGVARWLTENYLKAGEETD